jgi:response regulator RpfG family c-di-GMP phosphodiesterase
MLDSPVTILIADDEAHVLTALRRVLHGEQYRIFTADSADSALNILRETDIALIISDYRMPGTDGVTFLQEAKRIRPNTVRIILSGFADISAVVDAVNKGEIFKFIAKPWNDEELTLTIRQSLDHWQLLKRNRELAGELMAKNRELQELNEHLEGEVVRRSRELFLKDKRYLLAQYILEHLPVAILGVDENDMIALANRKAESVWQTPGLIGKGYEAVLDSEPARVIAMLRAESKEKVVPVRLESGSYLLHYLPIQLRGVGGNDLITMIESEPSFSNAPPVPSVGGEGRVK